MNLLKQHLEFVCLQEIESCSLLTAKEERNIGKVM